MSLSCSVLLNSDSPLGGGGGVGGFSGAGASAASPDVTKTHYYWELKEPEPFFLTTFFSALGISIKCVSDLQNHQVQRSLNVRS